MSGDDDACLLEDADFDALRVVGWDERANFEATALIAFFAFSGRMDAASGLPRDHVPQSARFAEATPDERGEPSSKTQKHGRGLIS